MKWRVLPFIVALSLVIQEPANGQTPEPQVTRRVQSDGTRDVRLEKAIVKSLADALPDDRLRFEYYYNRVDLDGDGRPEVLVFLFGRNVCGNGGCSLLIFKLANGEYQLVTDIALARNPVIVSTHKTHGWRDLILFVSGGGILPGHYVVLAYDGRTYAENATSGEPIARGVRGTAYLVGSPSPRSGIPLVER